MVSQNDAGSIGTELKGLPERSAADVLGISVHTLRKYRMEGRGPVYYKMGNRVVYYQSDLTDYRDGCRVVPRRTI
jgi:predicted site-specific integrase-resolvase